MPFVYVPKITDDQFLWFNVDRCWCQSRLRVSLLDAIKRKDYWEIGETYRFLGYSNGECGRHPRVKDDPLFVRARQLEELFHWNKPGSIYQFTDYSMHYFFGFWEREVLHVINEQETRVADERPQSVGQVS